MAYVMVSRGWLAANSRRYATLNIVGGLLGGVASVLYGAWPSAASNFIWAVVGLITITAALRASRPDAGGATVGVGDCPVSQCA